MEDNLFVKVSSRTRTGNNSPDIILTKNLLSNLHLLPSYILSYFPYKSITITTCMKKPANHKNTGYKSPDMRPPGDSPGGTHPEKGGCTLYELEQKPTAQIEKGRNMDEKRKEKNRNQCDYSGMRIEQKIGAHHPGNGPGSS